MLPWEFINSQLEINQLAEAVRLSAYKDNRFNKKKYEKKVLKEIEFLNLKKSAFYAKKIDLDVHAGHGLTYKSTYQIAKIKCISEFNIGHFLISESLFIGLKNSIKMFKKIIRK